MSVLIYLVPLAVLGFLLMRRKELDPSRPVLLCCASGSRSGLGVSLLKHCGFEEVHNAGCWTALKRS